MVFLVITVIGPDHPGVVEKLSRTVADAGGNWLESRFTHLAGQFAGVLQIGIEERIAEGLVAALEALDDLNVCSVLEAGEERPAVERCVSLELVGLDRRGIVRDVSAALSSTGINVEELTTWTTSAPMSGDLMFQATATLSIPTSVDLDDVRNRLEALANELMVDVSLDESPNRADN